MVGSRRRVQDKDDGIIILLATLYPFPPCRYLVAVGSMFKHCKKRFFTLIQLSQYKFIFCYYHPNGTQPKETLLLDQGLTVEYASDNGEQGALDMQGYFRIPIEI